MIFNFKKILVLLKDTYVQWKRDGGPRLGASLAYYTTFSLAPLLLLSMTIAGFIFGMDAARGRILGELSATLGAQAVEAIQGLILTAQKPAASLGAAIVGTLTLLLGASVVMDDVKYTLNKIWGTKGRTGFHMVVLEKLLSIGMVLMIGFLLLTSLVVSAGLSALTAYFDKRLPISPLILEILNFVVAFGFITLLFAALFKVLPSARIRWRDIWIGAGLTSFLFSLGKFLMGWYLSRKSFFSSYGAAGSVLVLLLWVYYSSQIFYFGAEFTKIYADRFGSGIQPRTKQAAA